MNKGGVIVAVSTVVIGGTLAIVLSRKGQAAPPEEGEELPPEEQGKFYMPPEFTRAQVTGQWEMPPYYYTMEFECPISNPGPVPATFTIFVGNDHPDQLTPWSFDLTLQPGETYLWKHSQMAVWPMTFFLQGSWEGDNYSEGTAR